MAFPRAESWRTRLWRWGFNFFPAYRGTGGQVTYIAADWKEVHVALSLSWRTRNYKKEGVWGSYKTHPFRDGIHGLPHVRPWRT